MRALVIHAARDLRPRGVILGRLVHAVAPGCADGICVDSAGNLWSCAADGVHCLAPDGTRLGRILMPDVVSNRCFGGALTPEQVEEIRRQSMRVRSVHLQSAWLARPS